MAVAMETCNYARPILHQTCFTSSHHRNSRHKNVVFPFSYNPQFGSSILTTKRLAGKKLQQRSVDPNVAAKGVQLMVAAAAGEGVAGVASSLPEALLFDCDGVLVDTERDGHRISFNNAFTEKGFDTVWDVELYGELLKIGGGKERMTHYFNKYGWPESAPKDIDGRKELVVTLHKRKTTLFMDLVEKGSLPLRPGVARLVDEALDSGVNVAVCSTSNEKAVSAIVRIMLGPERASKIRIFAGDVVPMKKPHPAIYLLASTTLGVPPERCVVIEDSHIGLSAAKAAGMKCIVTKSGYTEEENFSEADAIFDSIGDPPTANFDLNFAATILN
ncbi:unnamed protein product [Calypogeia fissa]